MYFGLLGIVSLRQFSKPELIISSAGASTGSVVSASHVPQQVASAVLIGVDLGAESVRYGIARNHPLAIRAAAENQEVNACSFLKLGSVMMPPALLLAIAGLLVTGLVR
jgi:arsenical pump membrane protein